MTEEVGLDQLVFIHPKLRPFVKVLLSHEFGLLKDLPKIYNVQSGNIVEKEKKCNGDRFFIRLSYCKKPLNWQIIMNGDDLTKPPDFILDENFLADATSETYRKKVPSLMNWDPSNVKCLLNVVLELLNLYKEEQLNVLKLNPNLHRYCFEYDTFVSMSEIDPNDIEVCVNNTARFTVVMFLIHLNVDFSKLPIALPNSKNLVVLVIEFKDNSKTTIQLMPRIELEDVFGGPMEIPDLPSEMSLIDYVPLVEKLLETKIEKMTLYVHQRKMLYSYLVQFLEPALINGDNVEYQHVTFLLELNDIFCVLTVNIPLDYPDSKPTLQLLSHFKQKTPRAMDFNSYKFSKTMSHEEIARSIFSFVKDTAIPEFQKNML